MAEVPLLEGPIIFVDVANESDQNPLAETVSATKDDKNEVPVIKTEESDLYWQGNGGRVQCKTCNKTAPNKEKLLQHIRKVHRGENPFQCYLCEYSTYNKSLFEDHVRIHQGLKPFKCPQCPYRSASKKNTKKHLLIHRPNNPLKCADCTFIARNTKVLNCHKLKQHGKDTTLKCLKCNNHFKDDITMANHKKCRKTCKTCSQTFCGQNLLNKHEVAAHGAVKKRKVIVNKKSIFTCKVCQWSTNGRAKVLLHLIHHPHQDLQDCLVDLAILRQYGILPPE